MFKNEIAPPESVQRAKQISVEKEEQDQVDRNAKNTGKLHGKALPGFSLFAQCHGETQTKTAKQSCRSHDNGYDPAQDTKKTIIVGPGDHSQEHAQRRQTDINGDQKNVGDPTCFVQFGICNILCLFCAYGKENTCDYRNGGPDTYVKKYSNPPFWIS